MMKERDQFLFIKASHTNASPPYFVASCNRQGLPQAYSLAFHNTQAENKFPIRAISSNNNIDNNNNRIFRDNYIALYINNPVS